MFPELTQQRKLLGVVKYIMFIETKADLAVHLGAIYGERGTASRPERDKQKTSLNPLFRLHSVILPQFHTQSTLNS